MPLNLYPHSESTHSMSHSVAHHTSLLPRTKETKVKMMLKSYLTGPDQVSCDWWRAGHVTSILTSDWPMTTMTRSPTSGCGRWCWRSTSSAAAPATSSATGSASAASTPPPASAAAASSSSDRWSHQIFFGPNIFRSHCTCHVVRLCRMLAPSLNIDTVPV